MSNLAKISKARKVADLVKRIRFAITAAEHEPVEESSDVMTAIFNILKCYCAAAIAVKRLHEELEELLQALPSAISKKRHFSYSKRTKCKSKSRMHIPECTTGLQKWKTAVKFARADLGANSGRLARGHKLHSRAKEFLEQLQSGSYQHVDYNGDESSRTRNSNILAIQNSGA